MTFFTRCMLFADEGAEAVASIRLCATGRGVDAVARAGGVGVFLSVGRTFAAGEALEAGESERDFVDLKPEPGSLRGANATAGVADASACTVCIPDIPTDMTGTGLALVTVGLPGTSPFAFGFSAFESVAFSFVDIPRLIASTFDGLALDAEELIFLVVWAVEGAAD